MRSFRRLSGQDSFIMVRLLNCEFLVHMEYFLLGGVFFLLFFCFIYPQYFVHLFLFLLFFILYIPNNCSLAKS